MADIKMRIQSDLERCIAALRGCSHMALDGEFTGIKWPGQEDNEEDTAETAMNKKSFITEQFSLIQLGISTLTWDCNNNNWRHEKFAFYFPRRADAIEDQDAMNYLQEHGFSIAKWKSESLDENQQQLLWGAVRHFHGSVIVHGPMDILALLVYFEVDVLPRSQAELSRLISTSFPSIYDIAHLCRFNPNSTVRLGTKWAQGLWKILDKHRARVGRQATLWWADRSKAHDAGEDAAATLECFYYMSYHMPHVVQGKGNMLYLHEHEKTFNILLPTVEVAEPEVTLANEDEHSKSVEQTPRSTAASSLRSSEEPEVVGQYYSESYSDSDNNIYSPSPSYNPNANPTYYSPNTAYNTNVNAAYNQNSVYSTNMVASPSQHQASPNVVYSTNVVGYPYAAGSSSYPQASPNKVVYSTGMSGYYQTSPNTQYGNNLRHIGAEPQTTHGAVYQGNMGYTCLQPQTPHSSNKIRTYRSATEMWLAPSPESSEDVTDSAQPRVNHNGIPIQYQ